jgi:aspartokinase
MLGTTTSEIKISVLLHKDDSEKAIRVLAEEFGLLEAE